MQSIIISALLSATLIFVIFPGWNEAWVTYQPPCTPCRDPEECNFYADCKNGYMIDACGRKVCLKNKKRTIRTILRTQSFENIVKPKTMGPDDMCRNDEHCQGSLFCNSCDRCQGCINVNGEDICSQKPCFFVGNK